MAAKKACGHDNLWTVGWIACKFGSCSLGISDDLINIWDESLKSKNAAAALKKIIGGGVIIFFICDWVFMGISTSSGVSPVHV